MCHRQTSLSRIKCNILNPMPLPESVIKLITAEFPSQEHQEIFELLSTYGLESHEREIERVLLDILFLANGDKKEIAKLVKRAKQDYRDIILWTEYPDQAKLDTPEKIRKYNEMLEKFGANWRLPVK